MFNKCTLLRQPYLESIGFVINQELHILICEGCGVSCTPKGVKEHINKKHKNGKGKATVDQVQVQTICDENHIAALLPIPDSAQAHIEYLGLHLDSGLHCTKCDYICREVSTLETHYKQQAGHSGQPPKGLPMIPCQRLTLHGKGSSFFQVIPREAPGKVDTVEAMLADLRKAVNSAGSDSASKLNARQINPWMLSTKWYLHVEGADTTTLKDFVAPNKEIGAMVKSYFANATKLLGSTADLVLQKINSPDHIKDGITNVPFHKHEQPETLPIYCGVVTSLLNLLLEDREHYEKTLPQDTIIALNVFESALEGSMSTTHDTSDELHKLLLQLWHREWATQSQESDIPDPTIRTLALRSLLADGSFKEPSAVAPDIAKFEHLMRLTSVREIHNLAALKYDGNQLKAANDVLPWLQEKLPTTFNTLG
ncbi:hypothetical protein FIBSPDRAFT_959644 [Athelia psychrophila]|uniref:C2H2-type domain-containing protein n=1 Tax=Athelia psychrophila TaxID=1759441 RepID=A0A166D8E2_9AGAM|nr:hypothetical protein FIBSPDRAFT_959644 [Fibularhizoctonia sp. CBS 109695]